MCVSCSQISLKEVKFPHIIPYLCHLISVAARHESPSIFDKNIFQFLSIYSSLGLLDRIVTHFLDLKEFPYCFPQWLPDFTVPLVVQSTGSLLDLVE